MLFRSHTGYNLTTEKSNEATDGRDSGKLLGCETQSIARTDYVLVRLSVGKTNSNRNLLISLLSSFDTSSGLVLAPRGVEALSAAGFVQNDSLHILPTYINFPPVSIAGFLLNPDTASLWVPSSHILERLDHLTTVYPANSDIIKELCLALSFFTSSSYTPQLKRAFCLDTVSAYLTKHPFVEFNIVNSISAIAIFLTPLRFLYTAQNKPVGLSNLQQFGTLNRNPFELDLFIGESVIPHTVTSRHILTLNKSLQTALETVINTKSVIVSNIASVVFESLDIPLPSDSLTSDEDMGMMYDTGHVSEHLNLSFSMASSRSDSGILLSELLSEEEPLC